MGVSVILTVKNDAAGCAQTLESLTQQTRPPDEIVIVDGGSMDDTRARIESLRHRLPNIRLIESVGCNIAQGRELATREAHGPVIASIDAGCRAQPDWLSKLVGPFECDPAIDVVAGVYEVDARTLFETVVGLATMRGQLVPFDPATFKPSGRSLAYTKEAWQRAGGWPVWLRYSEDTLFAQRLRSVARRWHFAGDALVQWRPRTTFAKLARQFYCYGTGRGHTQIGSVDFLYNIRNIGITVALSLPVFWSVWFALPASVVFAYFYVWTFHHKACDIVRRSKTWRAYPMTLLVMWVVLFSNLVGYLHGTIQRMKNARLFRQPMEAYLAAP